MPTFNDAESGASVRGKINAVINQVEQGGLGRNRLINGCMRVDQVNGGAAQTITAGAALAYTVDQWYAFCTGANVTGQRIALANGQNRYRFTGAASNTGVGLAQRVEAANTLDLADATVTLQVKLSSSSLTSVGWSLHYANTTNTFGTLASPTRTLINSGTFTGVTATEATFTATISIPLAAITGLELTLTGGALLGSQTLTIGDVQIERGSVATAYERRDITTENALCRRYFQRYADPPLRGVFNTTTTLGRIGMPIPEMRVAPVATFSGTFPIFDGSAAGTMTAFTAEYNTPRSVEFDATRATGTFTTGRPALVYAVSGAGILSLSARL